MRASESCEKGRHKGFVLIFCEDKSRNVRK